MISINVSQDKMVHLASTFGCEIGTMPFIYLGLPMGTSKPRVDDFSPMMDRVGCWYFFDTLVIVTEKIYYIKNYASGQIYHCSTSPGSISGIVIYILPQRRTDKGNILITYTYDG